MSHKTRTFKSQFREDDFSQNFIVYWPTTTSLYLHYMSKTTTLVDYAGKFILNIDTKYIYYSMALVFMRRRKSSLL